MIEAGVLEDPKVDAAFGMHIAQAEPLGTIVYRPGPSMAAADSFRMVIQGKGGHGARPHDSIDPIAIGAYIITALQTIVSREVDPLQPAVVTVGALLSGNAGNVIPDTAELRGTVRSFDPNVRQHLAERVQAVAKGVGAAMRAEVTIDYEFGYPPTVNDPAMTEIVRKAATEVLGEEHVKLMEPMMGAEDMSYFLEKVPGCYFHVGSKNEERGLIWGHHHPRFDFDEAALGIGIEVMMTTVLRYFEQAS
jgi:amidohydrolase